MYMAADDEGNRFYPFIGDFEIEDQEYIDEYFTEGMDKVAVFWPN